MESLLYKGIVVKEWYSSVTLAVEFSQPVVDFFSKEYREFLPYANFITANFITVVFQNYY